MATDTKQFQGRVEPFAVQPFCGNVPSAILPIDGFSFFRPVMVFMMKLQAAFSRSALGAFAAIHLQGALAKLSTTLLVVGGALSVIPFSIREIT